MRIFVEIQSEGEPAEALQAIANEMTSISRKIEITISEKSERVPQCGVVRPDFSNEVVRQRSFELSVLDLVRSDISDSLSNSHTRTEVLKKVIAIEKTTRSGKSSQA